MFAAGSTPPPPLTRTGHVTTLPTLEELLKWCPDLPATPGIVENNFYRNCQHILIEVLKL